MMKVLSLFDGYAGARVALDQLGYKDVEYYASEIEEPSIKVAKKNYPDIIHLGDVTKLKVIDGYLCRDGQVVTTAHDFDLLVGGSPCQGFSHAGNKLNFKHPKSVLYFEYERLLKEINPKYFLLENVCMKKEWRDIISIRLCRMPTEINSALLTAQNRPRLYWTNIEDVQQPDDKSLLFRDILLDNVTERISEKGLEYMNREPHAKRHWTHAHDASKPKSKCLVANLYKGVPYNVLKDGKIIRPLHPVECERLQGLHGHYTDGVAKTHRLRMLGNGFTVPIIAHILKNMS